VAISNIRTKWSSGNLYFKDRGSGNNIVYFDADNLKLAVVSGGALDIESGGAIKIAGTAVSASASELNAVADVSANGAIVKTQTISLSAPSDGTEQDTGTLLPAKAKITDVFLDVTAAEATGTTKTLNIGTLSSEGGGDADGFAVDIAVDSTGQVRPQATVTVGVNETYASANTRGALLSDYIAGSDLDGDFGLYREVPYLTDSQTAKSISFTAGSADFAEFAGTLIIEYVEVG